ncbi:MAG: CatA-like O-acetyltransferase [Pseudomonadota bacterium]
MQNFEKRRDRFNAFKQFENPLINVSFDLELRDFRPYCAERQLPPFHFFLYCVLSTLNGLDNFKYRIYGGDVIKIDEFYASYTVINQDHNLNFARFDMTFGLDEFVARSLLAKREAERSSLMINTAADLTERELKNNFYITCMPWLRLSAIEHPIFRHALADIPSFAWGKYRAEESGQMTIPFAVQAHHGFVDGYHIHQFAEALAAKVAAMISI